MSTPTLNQCDGCKSNMPIRDGIHYIKGKPDIYCQKEKYPPTHHTLRERFVEIFTSEWRKGFGATEDIDKKGIEGIADFFLSKFSSDIEGGIEKLEAMKPDERKVAIFGEYEARTYEDKRMCCAVIDLAISLIRELQKRYE